MVPDTWRATSLGDVVEIIHGWPFKSEFFSDSVAHDEAPIVVAIGNFRYTGGFRFDSTKIKRYTDSYPSQYTLRPGDILLAMTCQTAGGEILGIPGRVPADGRQYLHNQRLGKVVVREESVSPDFLYWLFLWDKFNAHLFATASGTKILHTSPSKIAGFQFKLPPIEEQRRIAAVLGALDDKIELNRKMSRTLEEMAQALFKSWFIDFDGHEDLVDSELGPIPRGWSVGTPSTLVEFDPRVQIPKGTEVTFVEMKAVPTAGPSIEFSERRAFTSGSKFEQGDTLLARITPCLENGKTALVDILTDGEPGFGSTEFIVMRGRSGVPPQWVYCLARSDFFRAHAIANMTGSSGRQRVPANCFEHLLMALPPRELLQRFGELAGPLFERISVNAQESRTLSALRDLLLPKLISGELRVPESLPLP